MADLFVLPWRPALDTNNKVIPGAQLWLTLEGTDVASTGYADIGLTTPLPNPVVANALGRWPSIYLDGNISYRARVYDEDAEVGVDTPIEDIDPYSSVLLSLDATSIEFEAEGDGAVSRTIMEKLRDVVHARDFGAVGDGDETDEIIQFFNSAIANPGTPHFMDAITYTVSSTLPDINVSGVWIEAVGCEARASLAGELSGAWIKYDGPATSAPFLAITSESGPLNRRVANVKFLGIGLEGSGLCQTVLAMRSLYDCDVVTAPINGTVTAVVCDDVASLAESRTSQRNRVRLNLRQLDTTSACNGIVLSGDATSNWSMNEFWIDAVHEDAPVVIAENVDNNIWHFFRAYQIPGGSAVEAISLLGAATEPESARAERFLFYSSTLPIHAYGTDEGYAYPSMNHFAQLDTANGTPVPVFGDGASVYYWLNNTPTEELAWDSYVPVVTATAGTLTTVANQAGYFRKIGKHVEFKVRFDITTNGTGAGGLVVTLPQATAGSIGQVGVGKETALNNKMVSALIGGAGATTMTLHNYDGTYPGANATSFTVSGTYEVA